MNTKLKNYFPMLKTRNEILTYIHSKNYLTEVFSSWEESDQKKFLDYCTGARGIKMTYDSFFKEIMNPEYAPERLENLLSALLGSKITIREILPNDSTRIADETSLLITDIVVELENGSLVNVEIQSVYNIVFFEKSTTPFHEISDHYVHHGRTIFDIGLDLKLPEEYLLISLDIFKENRQTYGIRSELDAWLAFLSQDKPEETIDDLKHQLAELKKQS